MASNERARDGVSGVGRADIGESREPVAGSTPAPSADPAHCRADDIPLEHLRRRERELLGERQALGDELVVDALIKLARMRQANRRLGEENDALAWREEYEYACGAIEILLRRPERRDARLDHLKRQVEDLLEARRRDKRALTELDAEVYRLRGIQEEFDRVRDERDQLREQSKNAFAMGRRSAA